MSYTVSGDTVDHPYVGDHHCKTCHAAYARRWRATRPGPRLKPWGSSTFDERFWLKVNKTATCWLWTGAGSSVGWGYGKVGLNGVTQGAHRYSYETLVGPIPAGLVLDHLCRNPRCVRPDHLEPVTQRENMQRGLKASQTRCIRGHEFTPENTYIKANGTRRCRACNRNRAREYQRRHRLAINASTVDASVHAASH